LFFPKVLVQEAQELVTVAGELEVAIASLSLNGGERGELLAELVVAEVSTALFICEVLFDLLRHSKLCCFQRRFGTVLCVVPPDLLRGWRGWWDWYWSVDDLGEEDSRSSYSSKWCLELWRPHGWRGCLEL